MIKLNEYNQIISKHFTGLTLINNIYELVKEYTLLSLIKKKKIC